MRHAFPWLWKLESRRVLWLLGLTFALVVTFQYVELPNAISSIFSSSKIPVSRNSTLLGGEDGEVEVDQIFDATAPAISPITATFRPLNSSTVNENATAPTPSAEAPTALPSSVKENATAPAASAMSPAALPPLSPSSVKENATAPAANVKSPAASPGLNPSLVKENATAPVASANPPAALPGIDPSLGKENATTPVASAKAPAALPGLSPPPVKENVTAPVASAKPPAALPVKEKATVPTPSRVPERNPTKTTSPVVRFVPNLKENARIPGSGVVSISEMSKQLAENRVSQNRLAKKPKWVTKPDLELLQARHEIENAPIDDKDPLLYAPLYRNVSIFKKSYELMEKMLKVYVYKEGKKPIMHNPILTGIYASEGWFMKIIESGNNRFVTQDSSKAHLFYLPFSSRMLEVSLYVQDSHSHRNLIKYLDDYVDLIAAKYPFWNRTSGADHFLAACHDWAPSETRRHFSKSLRAICNSDVKEGFVFGKDISLPETLVRDAKKPLSNIGGKSATQRPILAFFAGKPEHGYLRHILLSYWGNNKDPDMKIFGKLPRVKGNKNYLQFMKTSKYCICAKGFEVNSPRVVEAILYDCVPVIISDNFVPPLFEVFNWESFALFVPEKDIPNLKNILMSISDRRYKQMQMRVKKVQKHFMWHMKPEKYDMFNMILHSVWFNRVFQITV